ncbi:MAG: type I-C CRISPR-associated endonuclease Cas1c [Bifidobacterium psychraerophilum]|jgi:CRISPR-associated protein Cas1|uniref:type I-C CRISPR-associated endonuclease Cas1c n=1 Tax=Bifidobacterium psychraerophilum TaxID=218140 RepID=UPI0023F677B8|nr:type I-C CRISPR-associated endonuclease Cas1c [Bifidobacterium psychraerophilum]MCI1659702.1 type I-C CRISPR-associated endonuclease Cas1c [Bifidobacterium psychraerophilum]MCI2176833.1 type I-C CRISPR-associated endonuclease Cas1c [Bifidobacterium psychraerophilum]MCI2182581.1 type I-C CRISPR-associated endonuclease Cas1c [Bifidobacterium psychraerophilum]
MRQLLNTLFVVKENSYLALENDNVVVHQDDKKVASVPLRSIEQILCFSYKGASPALMGKCSEFEVGLSFFSPRGRYYCSVLGEKNRNVLLRREQFRMADTEECGLPIAQSFIAGKIFNCRWVLERTKRDHAMRVNVERISTTSEMLREVLKTLRACSSVEVLRGVEGNAAKNYFYVFDDLILRDKDSFFFETRSRRPPLDRMNALLSFVYSLLTSDCIAALQGVGLDPYVGFLHVDRPGRASLALDLMEEFRPAIADRFALSLVNTGAIKSSNFIERENGGIFLNEQGRKIVLTAWQRHKVQTITHPYLHEKLPWGLIPYVQALLLTRLIKGDLDAYPPFMWK